ncbi:unnamed protein product [Fusarium graminearum]|nr:unnamed protein product [Fusarium graminearum]
MTKTPKNRMTLRFKVSTIFLVHHNGHVAVAAIHDRNMIFLQTPEGPVKAIRHTINSDDWSADFTVPGNAAPETAIAAFATDVELVVGFFGTEHKIHVHRRNFQTGEWSGKWHICTLELAHADIN